MLGHALLAPVLFIQSSEWLHLVIGPVTNKVCLVPGFSSIPTLTLQIFVTPAHSPSNFCDNQ
jgi:hypothetical protein